VRHDQKRDLAAFAGLNKNTMAVKHHRAKLAQIA